MDEYEQQVEAMAADLGANGALPASVQMMNEAAREAVANGAMRPGPFFSILLNEKMPRGVAVLGDGGKNPPLIITGIT